LRRIILIGESPLRGSLDIQRVGVQSDSARDKFFVSLATFKKLRAFLSNVRI
jgi:hypothetical protein